MNSQPKSQVILWCCTGLNLAQSTAQGTLSQDCLAHPLLKAKFAKSPAAAFLWISDAVRFGGFQGFERPLEAVEEGCERGVILETVLKTARLLFQCRQSPCATV